MDDSSTPVPDAAAADPTDAPPRPLLPLLVAVTAVLACAADQATKYLAVRDLAPNVPVGVIDGWLQLRLIRNPGAAFSLATGSTWIFTVVAVVVSAVIVRLAGRLGSRWWAVALGLLLGGAVGNLLDRLFRAPGFGVGHVVDFIEYLRFPFMDFPVFNVADSCVVTAAGIIAVLGVLGIGLDGRREARAGDPAPTAAPVDGAGSGAAGATGGEG